MALRGPVLFLVPARGGSVRLPGKNLRTVAGIPLVGWGVRVARLAAATIGGGPHRVVCSTDDRSIADAARAWGAEILDRPAALATALASSADVALHALDAVASDPPFRALVLVQPTSPLTDPADLAAAISLFDRRDGDGVVSVTTSHPATFHVDDSLRPVEATDADRQLTGAFYIVAPAALRREPRMVVPGATVAFDVRPEQSVDIDEEVDLRLANALLDGRPLAPLVVAGRDLSRGGVLVIAEIGVNHNGDPDLAHRLVDAAADAGVDVVKFQTFDPDALASASAETADYQRSAGETGGQREMLARLALAPTAWGPLQAHAQERGLIFMSTPFDDASAELLDGLGVPAFKVGSGELTNLPFLRRLAARGRPILLSTGMAHMVEVAVAVDAVHAGGGSQIGLLHCVSSYPAQPQDANLRAMSTLRAAFGVPVGWSDHTPSTELPVAAVGLGATIIEKHLTLDATLPGPDHRASLEPTAFAAMVRGVRTAEVALGSGVKAPVAAEAPIAAVARRSLHWTRSLPAGRRVEPPDVSILRPGTGMAPARLDDVTGRSTVRRVEAGAPVVADDLEWPA